MELYVVRHGETQANRERRYSGWTETPLTEAGLKQAEKTGYFLADFNPHMLFCSDLQRARDTAGAIGAACGLQPVVNPLLREINFGQWEGKSFSEIDEKWPVEVKRWLDDPLTYSPPGGETVVEVSERMLSFMQKIKAKNNTSTRVVVVSHGGSIRALLHSVFNYDSKSFWDVGIANSSINLFRLAEGELKSDYYNYTGHLGDNLSRGLPGDH